MTPSTSKAGLRTTRWSRVARAWDLAEADAREALAELSAAYWSPIYALIRRLGRSDADLLDPKIATIPHWKADTDLDAIRDPTALARLHESERKECLGGVDEILKRLERKVP